MTIHLKTEKEIQIMREGGQMLKIALDLAMGSLKPGITTAEIDRLTEEKILSLGGKSSFKKVPGYHWTTCITINQEVVHGIPGKKQIKEGDIVSVDAGVFYRGFHTDAARTLCVRAFVKAPVGKQDLEKEKFLKAGEEALKKAVEATRPGSYVGSISKAIQSVLEPQGYSPVRALVGHGVGRALHEDPAIPGFLDKEEGKTPRLEPGMVLAIEVIYVWGKPEVILASDGWTIETKDGKISALFEETVALMAHGPLILTR